MRFISVLSILTLAACSGDGDGDGTGTITGLHYLEAFEGEYMGLATLDGGFELPTEASLVYNPGDQTVTGDMDLDGLWTVTMTAADPVVGPGEIVGEPVLGNYTLLIENVQFLDEEQTEFTGLFTITFNDNPYGGFVSFVRVGAEEETGTGTTTP